MKLFEPPPGYCGCKGLLWCVPEEKKEENGAKKNGDGEKKNGDPKSTGGKNGADDEKKADGDNKAAEEKQGETKEDDKEAPPTLSPLMQLVQCGKPGCYAWMEKRGDRLYGWLQTGFTANFAAPSDRVNYGANFNWRSNDVRLNQLYFVLENTLEHDEKLNVGYRVDFLVGNDAPFTVANGLFSDFTGFDPTSGFGVDGTASYRYMNAVGLDLPQFYLEAHLPGVITNKGIDVRVGKFYTYCGREVYPGKDTDFYSRTYENIVGTPFTHTGVLGTLHATDTWDVVGGVVVGADVFQDNNSAPSFHGAFIWNSCDKRWNWTTAYLIGPEQPDNDANCRSTVTSYLTATFGDRSEWRLAAGGLAAWEANAAVNPATGALQQAEWQSLSAHLFYTVDPRLILGLRTEWFRDDDGTRTAFFGRPGYDASLFDVTLGATCRPYENLRIRPEVRLDWSPSARAWNDQRDKFMTTAAIDLIWEF